MLNRVKNAVSQVYKTVDDKALEIVVAGGALVMSQTASAASALDSTQLTGFATTIGDTVAELKTWLIGIAFVVGASMFAVNITKKGLGKAGAR